MQQKRKKIIFKRSFIYLCIYALLVLVLTRFKYVYGSNLDWSAQHFSFPDYFRKLFYQTGNLFPSLALNIGGGENIYNFSYYGLFSPIILFSYLLPFVPMHIYIQIISFIGVISSVIIFYIWMTKKFDNEKTAFFLGIIFLFAAPLIFHSHRHIMFVANMPFLLLSLMSVDDYFEGRKKYKLVLFSFLTIMCCYFFAISALCSITLYGIYKYLTITEKVTFKDFFQKGTHFAGRLLTAVCMSAVLLIPTFVCLLSGRDKGNSGGFDIKTFLPGIRLNTFLFDPYSMGLGVFLIAAIICAVLSKEKGRRFLGITFSVIGLFPVTVNILNGFLYFDGKVMIAFIPICIFLMGKAYEDIISDKFKFKIVIPLTVLYCLLGTLLSRELKRYTISFIVADLIILVICLLMYKRYKIKILPLVSMSLCLIICTISANFGDKLTPIKKMSEAQSDQIQELAAYASQNNEFVRTANGVDTSTTVNTIYNMNYYSSNIYSSLHNKDYNNFYLHEIRNENALRNPALTIQSKNLCSNIYMSEKYLILKSDDTAPTGYEKIKETKDFALYENDNVLPWGYVSTETISSDSYKKLEFPQAVMALLNYTVTENGNDNYNVNDLETEELIMPELDKSKGISRIHNGYKINSETDIIESVKLPRNLEKDELLFISFDIDNHNKKGSMYYKADSVVEINGIRNKLTNPKWKYCNNNTTFEYTITTKGKENIDKLNLKFEDGEYKISNIKMYIAKIPDVKSKVEPFVADTNKTKGNKIIGKVNAENDGYFNISVPFSKGFTAKVDGKNVECEKVDTAFLGFKIQKGSHEIEIDFVSPGLKLGQIMSVVGFFVFILLIIREVFSCKKHKKEKSDNI